MRTYHIPLQVVFYKEDDGWAAHCLQFDLLGDGSTKEEALQSLNEAICIQIEASLDYQNFDNLFSPAEGKYFGMFAAGKDVIVGTLKSQFDRVCIQDTQTREYVEDEELVPA